VRAPRAAGSIVARCCAALIVSGSPTPGDAQVQSTNVPDALTRQSGLRVAPMPRPARTYATNCQGCHGDLGRSVTEIPTLAGRVGYFARIPEGRKYLVQLPNVALNPSSDEDLAEVLNWVLNTYSRAQLPPDFQEYTATEVAVLRKERIDVTAQRQRVIEALVASKQIPSAEALALPHSASY
jgi:mono/diheme cytochrome c family protein